MAGGRSGGNGTGRGGRGQSRDRGGGLGSPFKQDVHSGEGGTQDRGHPGGHATNGCRPPTTHIIQKLLHS
jgi:hypothetical protein